MSRPIIKIKLSEEERLELERRVRSVTTSKRDSLRAQIILLRAEGKSQQEVSKEIGVSHACVSKWTRRFIEGGIEGLKDLPGRGRKPSIPPEKVEEVITRVTQPPPGRTRWSVRSMAREVGISRHSVHQIWKKNDLKPHLVKTFKISKDPNFKKKFWDVIGLYLDPPDKALVLLSCHRNKYIKSCIHEIPAICFAFCIFRRISSPLAFHL